MSIEESVLCVPRSVLPAQWLGEKIALALDAGAFFAILRGLPWFFRTREQVEKDPETKQLIPYLVVRDASGRLTGCYRRNGSEKRLHDLFSVGIGGHVSRQDAEGTGETDVRAVVTRGLFREMAEEFAVLPGPRQPVFRGLIDEETTDVGRVHLGLVFLLTVRDPEEVVPGGELCDFRWLPTADVRDLTLELWSRLALELV